ncbi:SepM family pheromone-processing serine protease [Alkalibacterium kapii]|uniref:Peptidase S16 n=1 Tax=Alkalibacterium kapii TaxID=426704 RepID=A0A511ATJ2_9LACT|nr:SepM family pheromone-processing serine protease [Alkalibacterium kapii]GEK91514.1 peptidase S16 [Alkalibacterium kapii]
MNKKRFILKSFLVGLVAYLVFLLPIPYYIERPGSAVVINDKVEVSGQTDKSGSPFMLTTVEMFKATPFSSLFQILPYYSIVSESELLGDYDDYGQYRELQNYYMDYSIDTAKAAAFNAADLPYDINYEGVYVMSVTQESDFYGKLKMGDSITHINGEAFENTDEFIDYVSNQSVGDNVTLTVVRNDTVEKISGELIRVKETGKPGIGITLATQSSVTTTPEVSIDAGRIGGPSAGLMFSLQIYRMLVEEELADDLIVAGTGTIAENGEVGRIGGIDKKIIAADEEGADIFFAPDDEIDDKVLEEYPELESNYKTALETAEDIETDMRIVPVKNIDDAINYLDELQ